MIRSRQGVRYSTATLKIRSSFDLDIFGNILNWRHFHSPVARAFKYSRKSLPSKLVVMSATRGLMVPFLPSGSSHL